MDGARPRCYIDAAALHYILHIETCLSDNLFLDYACSKFGLVSYSSVSPAATNMCFYRN
jgi:hypothetical protein